MTRRRPGTLVLSLDTELVWGTFESGPIDPERYDGTRAVIRELLDLFDTYEIPVTWALVTHLLTDCRDAGTDVHSPSGECRDPRAGTLPCQQGVDPALWYEPSILDWISRATVDHEVALHSHTHPVFDEVPVSLARADVEASLEEADRHGVDPSSFVFPQNRVAHREVLAEAGIDAYRGVDARWYERQPLPEPAVKAARFAEEALELTPPIVNSSPRRSGGPRAGVVRRHR